ncbi:MAG: divalent-cation tolerance protein CutA [Meiothermus sp.]|uniref:divalent-cation tolerance protein CutA n=1 Tax=Meiothermus sp. TaxID=1955249 RepID=UPI0025EE5605|nr:divalent-cation tolerance protein CutA [Meiothermus sp.]MCS7058516.1 divalent-cation tolerance protein CutA [Meiothermus sp.]MCS7195420.1 divalent-cation tolerance protein CutA [Meiothermus sp.]MDW8091047.1 divalent-cation tolerance protein CutA [Meiothermus sp.]MDW8480936.1 divalent-cation tolerance protein CutA [Meiothermus sp.]
MYLIVLCTVPSGETGLSIARTLVHEGLAACVNLLPGLTSVYRWEGQVEENPEQLLLIKTKEEAYPALEQRIQELHPYQVPEVVAIRVERGLPAYLDWLKSSTQG